MHNNKLKISIMKVMKLLVNASTYLTSNSFYSTRVKQCFKIFFANLWLSESIDSLTLLMFYHYFKEVSLF